MKTSVILVVIIILMHTMTLVNVTIFDGEWNGIVLALSTVLFIIALAIIGIDHQKNKKI